MSDLTPFPTPPTRARRARTKVLLVVGGSVLALGLISAAFAEEQEPADSDLEAVAQESTAAPAPVETSTTAPPTTTAPAIVVTAVVDGDTVNLDNGERVRLVGIDAAETGSCGSAEATAALSTMVLGQAVVLEPSDEDRDGYGRLLRYVVVNGVDSGGQLLAAGLAVPRYNSTDGYGLHPREAEYAALARPLAVSCTPPTTAPPPPVPTTTAPPAAPPLQSCTPGYSPCIPPGDDVDCSGGSGNGPRYVAGPVAVDPAHGDPYGLDGDNDGIGCES